MVFVVFFIVGLFLAAKYADKQRELGYKEGLKEGFDHVVFCAAEVSRDARVSGQAEVYGQALVSGQAEVSDEAQQRYEEVMGELGLEPEYHS